MKCETVFQAITITGDRSKRDKFKYRQEHFLLAKPMQGHIMLPIYMNKAQSSESNAILPVAMQDILYAKTCYRQWTVGLFSHLDISCLSTVQG